MRVWVFWYYPWISNFWNIWNFQLSNFSTNQSSKPLKLLKRQFLTFWNQPKLISRKIRVAGKLLNFHNVEYPQPKVPIRLPGHVCIWSFILSFISSTLWKYYHFSVTQILREIKFILGGMLGRVSPTLVQGVIGRK